MTASSPHVSIIVPNYRHAAYLPQRLDSIFAQTHQDFELIILDDASPDESRAVIAPYLGDSRVRFFPNDTNSGDPFVQWNRGLGLASGKYVWIAESDDFAEPEFLEVLLGIAERHPSAGIVYCQSDLVNESSRFLRTMDDHFAGLGVPGRWDRDFFASGQDEVVQVLALRNTIPNASACLFRTDAFRRIGGATSGFRLSGDWITYVRLLEHSDLAFCARKLNHFRVHPATARHTSERDFTESLESYRVLNYIAEHFKLDESIRAMAAAIAFDRLFQLIERMQPSGVNQYPDLWSEAARFDRWLSRRINSHTWGRPQVAGVYYDDSPGGFSQERLHCSMVPSGARWNIRLGPCRGRARLDPVCAPGLCLVHEIVFCDCENRELWRADQASQFAGVTLSGTATSVPDSRGLAILAWGSDPILHFPDFSPTDGAEYFVECSLTAGASLMDHE